MHKSYKKTVAILITCALMSALLCIPVSALTVGGGAEIIGTSSHMQYGSTVFYANNIRESGNKIYFDYSFGTSLSSRAYETVTYFTFSTSQNYGTLKIYVDLPYGTVYSRPSYEGLYDAQTSTRLTGLSGLDGNTVVLSYTGYIPSKLYILQWFTYNTSSYPLDSLIMYDIVFTPIDKATQDIIDNQNSNTQAEIEADKENTQAIIDNQNELAEQEKQEITDSGNQATDAVDAIPNESEGFINALGTFVSTMSTTDTACSITFPAIKTPSFAGIPAATLSEEKEVDFAAAISLIPSDIMKLIQALTTIALIVYCFKELYDTISEALTRKKANSDG